MNLSAPAEITRDALVAEFKDAVTAASNAGETGHRPAEATAFAAQVTVNRLALRLGLVDEVERELNRELRLTGLALTLSRDAKELGL